MRITHVKRVFSFPFNGTVTWSRNDFAFNGDLMQIFFFFRIHHMKRTDERSMTTTLTPYKFYKMFISSEKTRMVSFVHSVSMHC